MTMENSLFLKITAHALQGKRLSEEGTAGDALCKALTLAEAQKLVPPVIDAVHGWREAEMLPAFPALKRMARVQVTQQAQRAVAFSEIYRKLEAAGVRALVVKGCICRSVWPKGELRISADEDLYVRDGDFAKACEVLQECGLVCGERANTKTDYEIGWRKPKSTLYIELHRKLFAPDSGATGELQSFFDDAFDRAQEYVIGGETAWSMSPEDHLLYLILHAYKHFIHSGFGIRQVCDIGLWTKHYREAIDCERLLEALKRARALYFAAAVFAIAETDLGIDLRLPACWETVRVDREPMLEDILDAGIYGGSSMSRQHSAPMTQEAVAASREERKRTGLLRRAFPPGEALLRSYPELSDHPARLPLVWIKRLAKFHRETKNDDNNSAAESLRIAKEREKLLRLYRII